MKLVIITALLLLSSSAYAGGLYNKVETPVAGEVVTYRRMPYMEVSNTLNQPVNITITTEEVKLYPDNGILTNFLRRVNLSANDYSGKNIPLIHPMTGAEIGYMTTDQYYIFTYSLWILAEKQADGLIRFNQSSPTTIYYTTNASDI